MYVFLASIRMWVWNFVDGTKAAAGKNRSDEMYKNQSRRMQQGSLLRLSQPSPRPDARLMNDFSSTAITRDELEHFSFDSETTESLLDELEPIIQRLTKEGFNKPFDISRRLNLEGLNTACGEPWTPRLVAFLLQFMFDPARAAQRQVRTELSTERRESTGVGEQKGETLGPERVIGGPIGTWRQSKALKGQEQANGNSVQNAEKGVPSPRKSRSEPNSAGGSDALWTVRGVPMSARAIAQNAAAARGMTAEDWLAEAVVAHARTDRDGGPANDELKAPPPATHLEITSILTDLQARLEKLESESHTSFISRLFGR